VTLLADVVATSHDVAGSSKRTEKVAALASLLRRLDSVGGEPTEVEIVVGFLVGWPRQGKVGVGWATLGSVDRAPAAPVGTVTVTDVDRAFERIAAAGGEGSVGERERVLADLMGRSTADERAFLQRLLLGEMRIGANAGLVTAAVAAAAGVALESVRRAAMLSGDLGLTATVAFRGGEPALAGVGLMVLRAVEPMLAASAPNVAEALLLTGPASVEWKLDGARIQVHKADDDIRVFTRNLNDVTDRLPGVVAIARSLHPRRLVLDGEAMGIDEAGRPRIFQDTMSEFGAQTNAGALDGFFFDVLHVDGTDLIAEPLASRRDVLAAVAPLHRIPSLVTTNAAEAERFLQEAVARGHEGVMVKALDGRYDAGRRGGAWRKVKPVRTLDLVVLAAEWGHGRRTGWLSNLHLGARGPDGEFVMVGKTFKGMTDDMLRWQTVRFPPLALAREPWGMHLRPELVVEIAVDGAQHSRRYAGGVALRFARVKRYREDKVASQADTIDAVRALLPARSAV